MDKNIEREFLAFQSAVVAAQIFGLNDDGVSYLLKHLESFRLFVEKHLKK